MRKVVTLILAAVTLFAASESIAGMKRRLVRDAITSGPTDADPNVAPLSAAISTTTGVFRIAGAGGGFYITANSDVSCTARAWFHTGGDGTATDDKWKPSVAETIDDDGFFFIPEIEDTEVYIQITSCTGTIGAGDDAIYLYRFNY